MRIAPFLLLITVAQANPLDHFRTLDIGPNKVPNRGTVSVLVIPTRVGTEVDPERWEELKRLYDPDGGPGTFRGYWQAVSNGLYDPVPVLADPVVFDECPLPERDIDNCVISLDDLSLITSGAPQQFYGALLAEVQAQGIDLAQFDTTGAEGEPDGYFDGVIVDSDLISGVGLPLKVLNIAATGLTDAGDEVLVGNVAMAPPDIHEFGHVLGFIDLYNGPVINDIMGDHERLTLSAFSRQQIGWGETFLIEEAITVHLDPVMDGGPLLRIGDGPQYLMIEHRGGVQHAIWDRSPPAIYVYAVDEDTLPKVPLGFLDVANQDLYFPNARAPHLNVNVPIGCVLLASRFGSPCGMRVGSERKLEHPGALGDTGWSLTVIGEGPGESLTVGIHRRGDDPEPVSELMHPEPETPPDAGAPDMDVVELDGGVEQVAPEESSGGGCQSTPTPWALGLLLLAIRRSPCPTGRA